MIGPRERALEAALTAMMAVQSRRRHPLGAPDEGIAYEAAQAMANAKAAIEMPPAPDVVRLTNSGVRSVQFGRDGDGVLTATDDQGRDLEVYMTGVLFRRIAAAAIAARALRFQVEIA